MNEPATGLSGVKGIRMTRVLDTLESALAYIDELENNGAIEEIELAGELASIKILVDGPKYHGTIPGELARGLWEFQESLYKAAAFALHGADDARKLTGKQRAALELVFEVKDGSSDISATFKDFLTALSDGFKNMNDRSKLIVIITVVAIIVGGTVGWKALETSADAKKEEVKATLQLQTEQEKTRQFALIGEVAAREPAVKRFERAAEDGTRAIVRSVPDAKKVVVGRTKFDRADIQEVNQRAPRTASTAQIIEGNYRVFGTESRSQDATKYVLSGEDGVEFSVTIDHADLSAEDLEKIWLAAKNRTVLRMEISVTKNKNIIRFAQVVSLL